MCDCRKLSSQHLYRRDVRKSVVEPLRVTLTALEEVGNFGSGYILPSSSS